MARKVFMIAPFEALTGNLSGDQDLQYAENNNPAYEAPNGTQYARNYKPRYVGNRRGKDGLVYFQVKQSTATVLTASSRRTMAVLGVTAAIRSALVRNHPAQWQRMNDAFVYLKEGGRLPEGQNTFNKWFSANIRQMLVYKRHSWTFSYVPLSFTIHNPYDMESSEALLIKTSIWLKFANWFVFSSEPEAIGHISVDSRNFLAAIAAWSELKTYFSSPANPNYLASLSDFTLTEGANARPQYNGQDIYLGDVLQVADTVIVDDEKYTTIAPES